MEIDGDLLIVHDGVYKWELHKEDIIEMMNVFNKNDLLLSKISDMKADIKYLLTQGSSEYLMNKYIHDRK